MSSARTLKQQCHSLNQKISIYVNFACVDGIFCLRLAVLVTLFFFSYFLNGFSAECMQFFSSLFRVVKVQSSIFSPEYPECLGKHTLKKILQYKVTWAIYPKQAFHSEPSSLPKGADTATNHFRHPSNQLDGYLFWSKD